MVVYRLNRCTSQHRARPRLPFSFTFHHHLPISTRIHSYPPTSTHHPPNRYPIGLGEAVGRKLSAAEIGRLIQTNPLVTPKPHERPSRKHQVRFTERRMYPFPFRLHSVDQHVHYMPYSAQGSTEEADVTELSLCTLHGFFLLRLSQPLLLTVPNKLLDFPIRPSYSHSPVLVIPKVICKR